MNAFASEHYVLIDYENIQPRNLLQLAQDFFHVAFFVGPNQETIRVEVLDLMQRLGSEKVKHIKVEDKGKNSLDFHLVYYLGRLIERNPGGCYHVISRDTGYDPLLSHLGRRQIKAYRHDDIEHIPLIKNAPAFRSKTDTPLIRDQPATVAPSASNPADQLIIQLGGATKAGKSPLLPLSSANFLNTPKKAATRTGSRAESKSKPITGTQASVKPATPTETSATKTQAKTPDPPSKVTLAKANLDAGKANRPTTVKALTNHLRTMFQKENLCDSDLATLIAKLQNKGHLKVEGTKVSYPTR